MTLDAGFLKKTVLWTGMLVFSVAAVLVVSPASAIDAFEGMSPERPLLAQKVGGPFRTMFGSNPNLVADVAEAVAPSVVNIDIARNGRTPSYDAPMFPFRDELFRRFFGMDETAPFRRLPGESQKQIIQGNGSGVIIDAAGYILTNNHVVAGADEIRVTLNDGRTLPATLIGTDQYSDIAVLKVDADNLIPVRLGNSDTLRPGEWVLAVGSPLGFDHTVTLGIISAISRRVPDINLNLDFIQTDAAINPGNSGGPLVNLNGEVVGINTAISGRGQNIGFAIPVNVAKRVSESLIAHGSVKRPWIGIAMTELTPPLAQSLGLSPATQGVVVAQVMPDSPSERAGFRQGDVIQRVNGKPITDPKAVQELVQREPVRTTLNFQILRGGQMMAIPVATDQLPDNYTR